MCKAEYRCTECETPHDNTEDAKVCCACESCKKYEDQLDVANDLIDKLYNSGCLKSEQEKWVQDWVWNSGN